MKIHLGMIKENDQFHRKKSGLVYSGFVKTFDELVTGYFAAIDRTSQSLCGCGIFQNCKLAEILRQTCPSFAIFDANKLQIGRWS